AKAARASGLPRTTLGDHYHDAISRGFVPGAPVPPEGFTRYASSVLTGEDGEIQRWDKYRLDPQKERELMEAIVQGFLDPIRGKSRPTKPPQDTDSDLLTAYVIGDAHLGLYAWEPEAGEDFDTDIAARDICAAIDYLVRAAPRSEECIIAQLGDFLHMDDSSNATPASGNQLDVDSRFPRVVRVAIRTLRYCIDAALKRHRIVRIRNVAGNHDPHASIAITEALRGYYEQNDRVIIEDSLRAMWAFRFGRNLIGITHGHAPKPDKMAGALAVDYATEWGQTDFKYIWHGHIHHRRVIEDMGCLIESFRTLAARDKYHADAGYRSGREMQSIVLHKEYG
ncbi:MAG: hypothetical protein D6773_17070, partial [Alphaproteobacteria bacterium]